MERWIFFVRQWIIPPIEMLIIAVVIYNIYKVLVRTRAIPVIKGIAIIVGAFVIATLLRMEIILWILNSGIQFFALAIVVIFSQEIRRIFSKLGTNNFITRLIPEKDSETLNIITETVKDLSEKSIGALIVFEKRVGLRNYVENTGVLIDGMINKELLLTIFHKNTALHDGSVICKDDRVIAASVVLPPSTKPDIDKLFGLRHRAGLGITEETDAVAIIVSEETGKISIAYEGKIYYNIEIEKFKDRFAETLYDKKNIQEQSIIDKMIYKSVKFVKDKKSDYKIWLKKLNRKLKNKEKRKKLKKKNKNVLKEKEKQIKVEQEEKEKDVISTNTSK